jgi:hypothetical protein
MMRRPDQEIRMRRIAMRGAGMLAAACLLVACEGIFTGTEAVTLPLEPDAAGGFKPVAIALTPDMSPVSLNFRAELGNHPHEMGKWNAYRATLSRGGKVVASRSFNVNYTGTVELPPDNPDQVMTMLVTPVGESGEYRLAIEPLKAVEVALRNPRVEVRRNVQVPR